ncbi:MAG: ribosome assembly factor SBDS [Candidatus Aenigmarchaeota archaeon]|nr:ribosome assembly factor SBDS [Candidatus Aenigmarchaeota archaeon]
MVSVDKAVTARITKEHMHFEILVDPEKAMEFKRGKDIGMDSILAVQDIFKDASKGERAGAHELERYFKTSDIFRVAEEIIRHGEVQLTTEQRRKLIEEKRRQIAEIISKQGINPQTKLPHPVTRILNAMDEARVSIDTVKSANEQVEAVLSKIQPIIPIAFERMEVAIKVPVANAGRLASVMRNIATVKKEEWGAEYFFAVLEIPAGMQSEIYKKLNDLTGGRVESKVIREIPLR